ncbi:hypothetical protein LTR06_009555 [Exophiala xenobiotica]|nr:hypothetical protein LTR06_009555 [Exophiala xenobiotica]
MSYAMTTSSRHMTQAKFDELSDMVLRITRLERPNYSDHEQQAVLALLHLRWDDLNSRDRRATAVSETGTIVKPPLTPPIRNESGNDGKGDYESVNDAFLPDNSDGAFLPRTAVSVNGVTAWKSAEQVGDLTGLHSQETWLCRQLNITGKVYRCQKARVFLGMAVFAEYNRQQCRTHPDKPQFLNMGRAQSQLFGNIDANKLSAMHVAFTAWGWMGEAKKQTRESTEDLCIRFPEAHRRKLVQEVLDWERGNTELPRDKWVATF